MTTRLQLSFRVASLLAGLCVIAGCSRSLLTAPAPTRTAQPGLESVVAPKPAPPPPSLLASPGPSLPLPDSLIDWVPVVSTLLRKDQAALVVGHRWSLQFEKGSLPDDATVTIKDYDPNVLDVQFGPHGTKFGVPVTLSVDFSNTAADPGAAEWDQREPVLYWLDERTNTWVEVPGRTDWVHKKHIVQLQHFSRYVVGGKAGWKGSPHPEIDN